MFCTKCGTKLPDDAKFCFACGNKTAVESHVPQQTDTLNRNSPAQQAMQPPSVAAPQPVKTETALDPKKIVLGLLWRALVIIAAIILAGGVSDYFELFKANEEISAAIIGDYDENGLASMLFIGTPYIVCILVLFVFLGSLMRSCMWFIIPFIAYWVTPFIHEELNNLAFQNMSDSVGAVCLYRATFYGLLTNEVEGLCKTVLIFLIPAFILNIIYDVLYPKKGIIQTIVEYFFPQTAKPAAAPVSASSSGRPSPRPLSERLNESEEDRKYWTCKKCGSRNSLNSESCKDCGAYK